MLGGYTALFLTSILEKAVTKRICDMLMTIKLYLVDKSIEKRFLGKLFNANMQIPWKRTKINGTKCTIT